MLKFDMQSLQEISSAVVVFLGVVWGGMRFWKSRQRKKPVPDFMSIHTQIHEDLTELRLNTAAMRTVVAGYHNGEYFANGVSMHKFSMTHESLHKGYSAQSFKMRNVLCSLCIPLINQVLLDASIIYHVEDLPDGYIKQFLVDENISHYAILSIRDTGNIIGFIMIQWHKDFPPQLPEDPKLLDELPNIRDSIALNLQYQKKD